MSGSGGPEGFERIVGYSSRAHFGRLRRSGRVPRDYAPSFPESGLEHLVQGKSVDALLKPSKTGVRETLSAIGFSKRLLRGGRVHLNSGEITVNAKKTTVN